MQSWQILLAQLGDRGECCPVGILLAYGGDNPGGVILILVVVVLVLIAKYYRPKFEGSGFAHGTARWATDKDLEQRKMLEGSKR